MPKNDTPTNKEADGFEEVGRPSLADQIKEMQKAVDKSQINDVNTNEDFGFDPADLRASRTTRDMESRDAELAPATWRPADVLPDPPQRPGVTHRWVRGSSRGELDKLNVMKAMREGWTLCAASDYPELQFQLLEKRDGDDLIQFGGLILMVIPNNLLAQREKYFRDKATSQLRSVNDRIRQEQSEESRIKFHNESQSVSNRIAPS